MMDSQIGSIDVQQIQRDDQTMGPLERVARLPPRWHKLPKSKCKIPTELLFSVNTGKRGCSSVRFSHNGYFLACAEINNSQDNHYISISEVTINKYVYRCQEHVNKQHMLSGIEWSTYDGIHRPFTNDL
jgi:hypothetical protein